VIVWNLSLIVTLLIAHILTHLPAIVHLRIANIGLPFPSPFLSHIVSIPIPMEFSFLASWHGTQQCDRTRFSWSRSQNAWRYFLLQSVLQRKKNNRPPDAAWGLSCTWRVLAILWTLVHAGRQVTRKRWIIIFRIVWFHCTCAKNI